MKDYLKMVQEQNPGSFSNGEKLILGFPPAWEFRGEYDLSEDVLGVDTKDEIWQAIFQRGLRSQKQKRLRELIVEVGLSDENLEKEIQRHAGPDGMTKGTGAAIPIEDYETLMRMFLRNCKNRFGEAFKNAWKSTYENVSLKDQCRCVDQADVVKGTIYDPDWTWLQTCIVKNSRVMKAEEYNQGGTPFSKIKQYIDAQLRVMIKPESIVSFYTYALETTFDGGRGTGQYELPQFLRDEVEATVRNKKARELLVEWRTDRDDQNNAASDDEGNLWSTVLAKDLLEKHLQSKRKRAILNSEIASAIDSRRQQEIADWKDHGRGEVLEGILRHLVKVIGKEGVLEACRRTGLSI